jgi:hypothetical protein
MSDWVGELSNQDDEDKARIGRVAAKNQHIFGLLTQELRVWASTYNGRNPQGIGFPNAVTTHDGPFQSASFSVEVRKNTEPKASLKLDFPINSGAMTFEHLSSTGKRSGTIRLDIKGETPTFQVDMATHSAESLVRLLLQPVLFPVDPWTALRTDAAERLIQAERAALTLEGANKHTAASELREANADLARESPDLSGAVQHSLAALECVARDHCGDHATFGKLLERYPDLFPKPLDKALEKIWGFASEMGRHLQEGRMPSREEAELLVGLAMACCTYLVRKISP